MKFYLVLVLVFGFVCAIEPHLIIPSSQDPMSEEALATVKSTVIRHCDEILKQSQLVILQMGLIGRGSQDQIDAFQEMTLKVGRLKSLFEMSFDESEIKATGIGLVKVEGELNKMNREFNGKIKNVIRSFWF